MNIYRLRHIVFALFLFLAPVNQLFSFHLMGGEITWDCQGGGAYVFKLTVYRDCNGPGFTTTGINLRVWNHPTLTSIPMNFTGSTDISPVCNAVPGGPSQISCGTGGSGTIERFDFQSVPINISGVPPAQGWAFTYDNFSRNLAIDNLMNPNTYGLTLRAIMFPYLGNNTDPCFDSSPTFLETPSNVICTGTNFKMNHHAYDADGDSLVFEFGNALDQISTTSPVFNPPVSPINIPYVAGYAFNQPTPGVTLDPGNIPAQIDGQTGEISFTSNTQGNFVVVVKVSAYRCGIKISEVYRETQIVVVSCSGNNLPIITPPFGGLYSTTVYAGQTVSFNLTATDTDLLQDGSPQTIALTATGNQFGATFTNAALGCDQPPCAVLDATLPGSSTNSISRNFTWQTDCSHLTNTTCGQTGKVFQFVFRASDDFCPAPGVSTATVSITVLPSQPVSAPSINCADVALNGDVTLTWTPPLDPAGTFVKYEIFNATSGTLVGTIPVLATNSFTHIGADAQNGSIDYLIKVYSGCTGTDVTVSDTIHTMFVNVINAGTGVAVVQWNPLFTPVNSPTAQPFYTIWQEYPIGTWTPVSTVNYGTNQYFDTISICDDTLNYKISVQDSSGCISFSSIDGDRFTDLTEPLIPVMSFVTVDTASGLTNLVWYPSGSADTEGYIILENVGGSWLVIDTIYGILNTSYIPLGSTPNAASESYGVAAFDTCWHGTPASPNTSAMGNPHNTIYTVSQLNICDSSVTLSWTAYTGWPSGELSGYEIYYSENNGPFILAGTTSAGITTFIHANLNRGSTYKYLIKAINNVAGVYSLSNFTQKFITIPSIPTFVYLQTATVVSNNEILIRIRPDVSANVQHHNIYRSDDNGFSFNYIGLAPVGGTTIDFTDNTVNTQVQSYIYKVATVDSCGQEAVISNEAKTIFLQVIANSLELANYLNWNPYMDWDGNINDYQIHRSVNRSEIFEITGSATPLQLNFKDDVTYQNETVGEFCYKVVGTETINTYGISEISESNEVCVTIDPLVYVPNAFTPGGANPIFKPVVSYVDFTNYEFEIYNRWGERIYRTVETTEGWDGYHSNHKMSKEDVYVYRVKFRTGDGKNIEKQGHVTLIDYEK